MLHALCDAGRPAHARLRLQHVLSPSRLSLCRSGGSSGDLGQVILKDKSALITGASRGLGAAIAQTFAVEGAKVAFTYARDEEGAAATAAMIRESGGDVRIFKVSVIDSVGTEAV